MNESEKERYYDMTVAPQLAQLARNCALHGLSFFAAVQYSEHDIAETRLMAPGYMPIMMDLSSLLQRGAVTACFVVNESEAKK